MGNPPSAILWPPLVYQGPPKPRPVPPFNPQRELISPLTPGTDPERPGWWRQFWAWVKAVGDELFGLPGYLTPPVPRWPAPPPPPPPPRPPAYRKCPPMIISGEVQVIMFSCAYCGRPATLAATCPGCGAPTGG